MAGLQLGLLQVHQRQAETLACAGGAHACREPLEMNDMQDAEGWVARLFTLKGSDWQPLGTGNLRFTNVQVRTGTCSDLLPACQRALECLARQDTTDLLRRATACCS